MGSPEVSLSHAQAEGSKGEPKPIGEDEANPLSTPAIPLVHEFPQPLGHEERQCLPDLQLHHLTMTIESAIEAYLQEQRNQGRRRKTLEWHQTALRFLQQYLVRERHLTFLSQLTESEIRGWVTFLRTTDVFAFRDAQTSQYHFHLWALGTSLLSLGRAPGLSGSNSHHAWRPSQGRKKTPSAHRTGRV